MNLDDGQQFQQPEALPFLSISQVVAVSTDPDVCLIGLHLSFKDGVAQHILSPPNTMIPKTSVSAV